MHWSIAGSQPVRLRSDALALSGSSSVVPLLAAPHPQDVDAQLSDAAPPRAAERAPCLPPALVE